MWLKFCLYNFNVLMLLQCWLLTSRCRCWHFLTLLYSLFFFTCFIYLICKFGIWLLLNFFACPMKFQWLFPCTKFQTFYWGIEYSLCQQKSLFFKDGWNLWLSDSPCVTLSFAKPQIQSYIISKLQKHVCIFQTHQGQSNDQSYWCKD